MLAGERPFRGGSASAILDAIRHSQAPGLDGIPRELERIVNRCLEKNREARYSSAEELLRDLERFQGRERMAGQRAKRIAISAAAVCVAGVILGTMTYRSYKRQWARFEAVAQARSLAGEGRYTAAFRVAEEAARILPQDSVVAALWPEVARNPLGGFRTRRQRWSSGSPYLDRTASWTALGATPIKDRRLPMGALRLRLSKEGYEPLEIGASSNAYRYKLEAAGSAPTGMALVRMLPLHADLRGIGSLRVSQLPEFYLDRYEVSNRQFREFVANGGYTRQEYWKVPIVKDGSTVRWEEAMKLLVDATGQPGPAAWEAGSYAEGYGRPTRHGE